MRKRRARAMESVELEGPASATLTPPPTRRTGVWVVTGLAVLVLVGIAGLAVAAPELFITAVQAFVGGR